MTKIIGYIERLQIQPESLKTNLAAPLGYDPSNLLEVTALKLTLQGCVGVDKGQDILDIHHQHHARSGFSKNNGVSFNFTSHYQKMQQHFGDKVYLGCAGENIIISSNQLFTRHDLSNGISLEESRLESVTAAPPCAPFASWILSVENPPPQTLKAALQFLQHGTRGFYATCSSEEKIIRVGDTVRIELKGKHDKY
jgi:hypothetical protein